MTLDAYLEQNRITELAFGQQVGLSQPHIHRLRFGKSWPSREAVERIREATGGQVTANDFLPAGDDAIAVPDRPEAVQ